MKELFAKIVLSWMFDGYGWSTYASDIWVNVFKNGPSRLSGPYHFKFFKGCLPQILLGAFLNALTHIQSQKKTLAQR